MNFLADNMQRDLQTYTALCDEMLALVAHENQTLQKQESIIPGTHDGRRKDLLARLNQALAALRIQREAWQLLPSAKRSEHTEILRLVSTAQQLAMKLIVLNRENEQALLQRGFVPARHLATMPRSRPNFAAGAYQNHQMPVFS